MKPITMDAYNLMHDSVLVLSRIEQNGIRVDVDYCRKAIAHLGRRIARMDEEVLDSEIGKLGKKTFGFKFNIKSDEQLAHLIYDIMGMTSPIKTSKGNNSVKAEILEVMNIPGLDLLVRSKQLEKARTTYLTNFLKEEVDGYMHPLYHLNLARTYRSSSSDPNFQNIPNRDAEITMICRKAIIPRPGRKIAALDFSGVEVRVGTAYHKDPVMMKYNSDPSTDLHRDMAQEIYCFDDDEWGWVKEKSVRTAKAIRHSSKNQFVFPSFYGDWYKSCAPNLWKSAHAATHILPNGLGLEQWLHKSGIKDYDDFETHMKEIDRSFWEDRFSVYSEWKDQWYKDYQRKGHFDTLTGFRCQGVMGRNDVINYPVQGSAFHFTLYSMIEIDKVIQDNALDTLIIGQIHDELVLDLVPEEEEFLLRECKRIMTEQIRDHWKWINVPIDVEIEVTPVDGSWIEKSEIIL